MSLKKLRSRIVNRHGSADAWNNAHGFIPYAGEVIIYDAGYDSTTHKEYTSARIKIGDGKSTIQELPFAQQTSANVLTDVVSTEVITHVSEPEYVPAEFTPPTLTHSVNDDILTIHFDSGSYQPAEFTPVQHHSATLSYVTNVEVSLEPSTK